MDNTGFFSDRRIRILSNVTIIFGFLFLVWRVRFGYCFNDEPFILTLAHRLTMGDNIIIDEWNMGQLFGLAILPLVKIYKLLVGSTEGILLFSRYCFCIAWFATAVCTYRSLRRYSRYAIFAFVYLVLFAPLDYMTCSYTSFGLMGTMLLGCLYLYIDGKQEKTNAIWHGLLFAILSCIVVLSSPYFAVVYILATALLIFVCRKRKGTDRKYYTTVLLSNLAFAIAIGAICFAAFVLSGHTVSDVLERIPYVFYDPVHTESFFSKIVHTASAMYRPMLVFYTIGAVLILLYCTVSRFRKYKCAIALYCAVIFVFSRIAIADAVVSENSFNYEMLDLGIFSFAAFFLLDKKPWKLFIGVSCTDLLYTVCTFIASNTKLMSLSAAMVPCGVAGIIYIIMLAKEIENESTAERKSAALIAVAFLMLCQFSLQICVRTSRQYWDAPLPYLSEKIECGAAKGLVTEPEKCEEYESEYEALQALLSEAGDTAGKRFVNLTSNPVIYLDADLEYGTFSSWTFGYDEKLADRFMQYYEVNPQNAPELIFYTDEVQELTQIFDLKDYSVIDNNGYHLLVKNS